MKKNTLKNKLPVKLFIIEKYAVKRERT